MTEHGTSGGEMRDELWTTREVAEFLRVSERHVSNLSKRGEFVSPIRLGRSVRYQPWMVRKWFEDGGRGSVA
jgi:predicted DNA-binding transcriptional regulator AlpA